MLHACIQRFDVTGTVENVLGTKRGLSGQEVKKKINDP